MKRPPNSRGFTLIEVVLVLAISGALFVMIFAGQRQLRSRATFDAAVEKTVASINDAHNQALAGINTQGPGTGDVDCAGGLSADKYVFAGVIWSVVDSPSGATFTRDYYAADRTSNTECNFKHETLSPGDVLRLPGGGPNARRIAYIRDQNGGLVVCTATSSLNSVEPSMAAGACTGAASPGGFTLNIGSDHDNFTSHAAVGANGLASRTD